MTEFGGESATDSVVEMIGLQRAAIFDGSKCIKPSLRAMHAGDGHGAVHGGDR